MVREDRSDWLSHVRWYGSCAVSNAVVNDIIESVPGGQFAGPVCQPVLQFWRLLPPEAALYALVAQRFRSQHLRTTACKDSFQGDPNDINLFIYYYYC